MELKGFLPLIIISVIVGLITNAYAAEKLHIVTKVLDGDTIVLDGNETVRLIGVDTPELHHPKKPTMYFAQEAYLFTSKLTNGKKVKLVFDEANTYINHKDKYGRTLAYIYLEDGAFVNAEIIKQGYGFAYTRFPFKYMDDFRKYQQTAMENEAGLWKETIHNPEVSNLIMNYENIDEEGKKLLREFLEFLSIKYGKGVR